MTQRDVTARGLSHTTGVFHKTQYDGYVGKCSCGWTSEEMAFAGAALRECQRHEREVGRV